jgi:NitT/TauT family transport system substrate-binding protein
MNKITRFFKLSTLFFIFLSMTLVCINKGFAQSEEIALKIGYFPNITHAHALIAQNMTEDGKDWYEQRISEISIDWVSFNAGPSAMEALFAKSIDITYVGPNPAINAYIRSGGKGLRVISGAMRGGAALVVQNNLDLANPKDFLGKRIATPQLGNTQDVACRNWFLSAGMKVTMVGGDLYVIPTPNSAMLSLFLSGDIDAAWTVEPWVSRLELDAGGKVVYLESAAESLTTVLTASDEFIGKHPQVVRAIAEAGRELNDWILNHPEEAQERVAAELTKQTRREFSLALVQNAWPRLVFDANISAADFFIALKAAQTSGFIDQAATVDGLVIEP